MFLSDRSFMPGDVVRRLIPSDNPTKTEIDYKSRQGEEEEGKETTKSFQKGICKSVDVRAAVKILGTNFIVLDAASVDLRPVEVEIKCPMQYAQQK